MSHLDNTILLSWHATETPSQLLALPDLVLYEICAALSSPFDLLNFGCTCRRLHELTSSRSLWLSLAMTWCEGMWHWLDPPPDEPDPKTWLLALLRAVSRTAVQSNTRRKCELDGTEVWERLDNRRFSCKVGMLKCTYKDVDARPSLLVLMRRWLYDVALYRRKEAVIRFADEDVELSDKCVAELASLGRAREGDLRGRKQPHIDPRYYVRRIGTSRENWAKDLFPSGSHGSLCPMLACPSQGGYMGETSKFSGLAVCVSHVLAEHLGSSCKDGCRSLSELASTIQRACTSIKTQLMPHFPEMLERWPGQPIAQSIFSMAEHGWPNLDAVQADLEETGLSWRELMAMCAKLLAKHRWLDAIVDQVRESWRHALVPDIVNALGGARGLAGGVTRINLTDCDWIGGDNQRQEVASAAFISPRGVLVTWHLIGRASY